MKNLILVLMLLVIVVPAFSQEKPQVVMLKDTTFVSDPRLNFFNNTILPAIANFVDEYNLSQKVSGQTITFKAETNQLVRKIEKSIADYSLNFIEVKDVEINPVEIVNEYNALNTKINLLQADPEIKYIEVMNEFKRIKDRQRVLSNYYKQIYSK